MRHIVLAGVCWFMLPSGAGAQPELREAVSKMPGVAGAPAQRLSRYYFVLGRGAAVPLGGHWGDRSDGFKPATAFLLEGARKVDDTLSYGLETSYSLDHKNRTVTDMRIRIFSFTPFMRAAYQSGKQTYYGIFGAGVYQWAQPRFSAGGKTYASDSGSSFGINMGGGAMYPLWGAFQLGLELRWHHIFAMRGDNFNVDSADNIVPSAFLVWGWGRGPTGP